MVADRRSFGEGRAASGEPAAPVGLLGAGVHVALALIALVFFLPLMVLVAAAVWLQDGGPILFSHRRVGRGGRPFYCLKFRTMAVDAEARLRQLLTNDPAARAEWDRDHKLRNDPRVTPLGRFLRQSSLDELPQLINVVRRDMDLVGPRPIVEAEIAKYGARFHHYCAVNPGITGLWQVSGRNDVSYRSRVAMDCLYARSKTPTLDLWLILCTVPAVLLRRGSY
jgi:lipopolysaccharide/colanic/teichoic acid biosynthesis glycosyltransferase